MKDDADLSRIMKGFKASGDPYFYFWTALRKHFLTYGSNQTKFAEKLGVDQSYLSRVLAGTKIPTHTTQEKMANGLGTTISGLLDEGKEIIKATPPPSLSLVPPNYVMPVHSPEPIVVKTNANAAFVSPFQAEPGALRFIVSAEGDDWAWGVDSPLRFDDGWLRAFGDPSKLGVFKATETAMQPAIPKGSLVVVDTAAMTYVDDDIYLLNIFGSLFFARFKWGHDGKPGVYLVYDEGDRVLMGSELDRNTLAHVNRVDQKKLFRSQDGEPLFTLVGRAVLVINPLT